MPYQPGDILIDKYRIEALIGKGAFAQVYRAEEIALRRTVAIKVLRKDTPGVGNQVFEHYRDRFQLEAQLGARIDSAYVIRVHTLEISDDDLYLIMEHAARGSLRDRIEAARTKGGNLPIEEVINLGIGAARGLAELHGLDIVHRDVKPSNILISENGQAKLGDLGLAQTPESRIIRIGQGSLEPNHPGTPEYMPPEQQPGQVGALRASADVFALGSTLFEALTGRMVFHQKPGVRACNLRPDMPGWLDELLVRMLAEEPKERPWDGTEVVEVLLAGQAREASRKSEELRRTEEQSRLAAENTRREVEQRAVEIAGLVREAEAAFAAEQWRRVEQFREQLKNLGEAGQVEASRLAEKQAIQQTEQRAAKVSQLRGKTKTAIASAQWKQAEQLLKQLESLGEEGRAEVARLRETLSEARQKDEAEARRKAEYQKSEIERLEAEAEKALMAEDWSRVKELCAQMERLGVEGKAAAQRIRSRMRTQSGWRAVFPTWGWWAGGLIGVVVVILIIIQVVNGGGNGTPTPVATEPAAIAAATITPRSTDTSTPADTTKLEPTHTATTRPSRTPTEIPDPTDLPAKLVDDSGVPMVLVPAGAFEMGSEDGNDDEKPVHTVTLSNYYIDQYEVTNALFAQFLNQEGNQIEGGDSWLDAGDGDVLIEKSSGEWAPKSGYADHPVVEVSWYGASAYCQWRGARLPTEAEWEKAARGTDRRTYPWGEGISCDLAQYSDCGGITKPVGSYPEGASPYGLLDMVGNVWEWVQDWYDGDYYGSSPDRDPQGPTSGEFRVLRGGSWGDSFRYSGDVNRNAWYVRAANRFSRNPDSTSNFNGFRCARSP